MKIKQIICVIIKKKMYNEVKKLSGYLVDFTWISCNLFPILVWNYINMLFLESALIFTIEKIKSI